MKAGAPLMAADTPQPVGRGIEANSRKWRPNNNRKGKRGLVCDFQLFHEVGGINKVI